MGFDGWVNDPSTRHHGNQQRQRRPTGSLGPPGSPQEVLPSRCDLLGFIGCSCSSGMASCGLTALSLSDRAGHPSTPSVAGQDGEENPATLAENCFRELLGRAAYGNMNNAVRPVLV